MQIAFWGAGLMGSGLAKNLLKKNYAVSIYSRDAQKAEALAKEGALGTVASQRADLAKADVLITCLARPVYVREGLLGAEGLYNAMRPQSLHIECSTIGPSLAEELAEAAQKRGTDYLQATLGKTPQAAEKAEEPIFVGGEEAVQQRAWPILCAMGKPENVGTIRASCAIKLISNLIGMTNICVLAEGMRLAKTAQMDLSQVLHILAETGAHSFQMDVRGPMMAEENYADPKFRLTLALKDMTLATEMAADWKVDVPIAKLAKDLFSRAEEQGLSALDCAAVAKVE